MFVPDELWKLLEQKPPPDQVDVNSAAMDIVHGLKAGTIDSADADSWRHMGQMQHVTPSPFTDSFLEKAILSANKMQPTINRLRRAKVAHLRTIGPRKIDLYIHPSVRGDAPPNKPLQATWVDDRGPGGHFNASSMADAVKELWADWGSLEVVNVQEARKIVDEARRVIEAPPPKNTLELANGWLCVVYTNTLFTEPKLIRYYWPVMMMTEQGARDRAISLGDSITDHHDGLYIDRNGGRYRLKDGNSTKPIKTEELPYPFPLSLSGNKTARWHNGGWEYHTPRSKWIRVPSGY